MSIDPRRLLGLAFASADLLLEIDGDRVVLALGATQRLMGQGEAAIMGRPWRELIAPFDHALVEALIITLEDGARHGPVVVRLVGEPARHIGLILRRLPENGGRISCGVTAAQPPAPGLEADGLRSRKSFEDIAKGLFEAARVTGLELELAMVEISGLTAHRQTLSAAEATALDARVVGALRAESYGGSAATRLAEDRFSLLRAKTGLDGELAHRVSLAVSVDAAATVTAIDTAAAPSRALRALRYALDDFLREGLADGSPASLAEAMNESIKRTLARAGSLSAVIAQRRFRLAYQPVVNLHAGLAHHHEALVRFEGDDSPFAMIRMAEEFDLIEALDHVIVEKVVRILDADRTGELKLAANISGRTIVNENFVDHVERLLARHDRVQGRLIFELTESTAVDDLPRADRHIQVLRSLGCLVCLDDFGAGAASFAYLQELHLDIVKIDGRYVRELGSNSRDGALVRRLVELCQDLKVRTVAEMVETPEIETIVKDAGVDFAQGWLYGRPADRPLPALRPTSAVRPAARRAGASESWG